MNAANAMASAETDARLEEAKGEMSDGRVIEPGLIRNLVDQCCIAAMATALARVPDRAEEVAFVTVREGFAGTRRQLATIVEPMLAAASWPRSIRYDDAAAARRVFDILIDPLAQRFPHLALRLCASAGVTSEQARDALGIAAINGTCAPSVDPGGERLQ